MNLEYKFDNNSHETEPILNAVFILKDENYYLTSGKIYLKTKKHLRLLEILRNPELAENYGNNAFPTNTYFFGPYQIIIKNPFFGERYIDISTIAIAYEKQVNNITDDEIKAIDDVDSLCKKEEVSLSNKDNHASELIIKGEGFGIKSRLDDDLNYNQEIFTYLKNPNLTATDRCIDNYLTSKKITQSWDMLINLKYFKKK
ncbi:MAG: hypothetical protein PHV16_02560 [Candidatus Nanoarchaeia archaeon]|nr:hypothetical protein [Candidatus Nanoarchaeia archaeon]